MKKREKKAQPRLKVKPLDWSSKFTKRSKKVGNPFRDHYLMHIEHNVAFPKFQGVFNPQNDPFGPDFEYEYPLIQFPLSNDAIDRLKEVIADEIIMSDVPEIHDFFLGIAKRMGRCNQHKFNEKPPYLDYKLINQIMSLIGFVRVVSTRVTVEIKVSENQTELRDITFPEWFLPMIGEMNKLFFRLRKDVATIINEEVYNQNRFVNQKPNHELNRFTNKFDGDYNFDLNKPKILLIYLNEVLVHLIAINRLKIKSSVRVFALKILFLCDGNLDVKNIDEISEEGEKYDYLKGVYSRAMKQRDKFFESYQDSIHEKKYNVEKLDPSMLKVPEMIWTNEEISRIIFGSNLIKNALEYPDLKMGSS
jgi:hypothetical protein